MRIVLDTNVLISAFVFNGFSQEIYDHCFTFHQLYISDWILNEFKEKMEEKLKVPDYKIEYVCDLIQRGFRVVNPAGTLPTICRDSDDNNVLLLAEVIEADYIITGDKDLLVLGAYKSTKIDSPRGFWEKVIREQPVSEEV